MNRNLAKDKSFPETGVFRTQPNIYDGAFLRK